MTRYKQKNKQFVRHKIIRTAVEALTVHRENAACVRREYVRSICDEFTENSDCSRNKDEASRIDKTYVVNWESLHDSFIGKRDVRDLVVCYLCGPEPNNDFQEFVDLGILPQNIWAFESDKAAYAQAVDTYKAGEFPQPRILKQNIDTFFRVTPKKFDIIYIDACGTVPSAQHSLKTISTMCLNSRLNSPGIIITNFSSPDLINEKDKIPEWSDLITLYRYFKEYSYDICLDEKGDILDQKYEDLKKEVCTDFRRSYGEFISALLRDIPSVIIPIQRIDENSYLKQFITSPVNHDYFELMRMAKGNSLASFFFYIAEQKRKNKLSERASMLIGELGELKKITDGFEWVLNLRNGRQELKEDIKDILYYFETNNTVYQFLDKPHSNLVFDAIINQLIYPMHFNPEVNYRYFYKAKVREMYTDISVFDECRYIYEWLPALHQLKSCFENVSWQYVFRFSMDGLIRTRMNFNNEFFYQGAVLSHEEGLFAKSYITDRKECVNF